MNLDWKLLSVIGAVASVVLVCGTVLAVKGVVPGSVVVGAIGTVLGLLGGLPVNTKKDAQP